MGRLTVALYRPFIKARFATLVNIMQDRAVMPEFLQENCTPEKLAFAVGTLMEDETSRDVMKKDLAGIASWLGRGAFTPSDKAAETVWRVAFPEKEPSCP